MAAEDRIILMTAAGTAATPDGPGGWAAIVRAPWQGREVRVRGSDPRSSPHRMQVTALVRGLAQAHGLIRTGEISIRVSTDSLNLIDALERWNRGEPDEANRDLWMGVSRMGLKARFTMRMTSADIRDLDMKECAETARKEYRMAANHPGMEARSSVEIVTPEENLPGDSLGGTDPQSGFVQGWRAGYQAAKTDMANALNQVHREPPEDEMDDLPF